VDGAPVDRLGNRVTWTYRDRDRGCGRGRDG